MYTLPSITINRPGWYALVLGSGPSYSVRIFNNKGKFVCTLHNVALGGRRDPDIATKISEALDVHTSREEVST